MFGDTYFSVAVSICVMDCRPADDLEILFTHSVAWSSLTVEKGLLSFQVTPNPFATREFKTFEGSLNNSTR